MVCFLLGDSAQVTRDYVCEKGIEQVHGNKWSMIGITNIYIYIYILYIHYCVVAMIKNERSSKNLEKIWKGPLYKEEK